MKQCCKCKICKPISEFRKDKYNNDGLTYDCKNCRSLKEKEYHKNKPEIRKKINLKNKEIRKEYWKQPKNYAKLREQHLRKKFGITLEDYNRMFDEQKGVCSICNRPERTEKNKNLSVDHNHETGKIRKLLCSHCNRGLGLFSESINYLTNAINYLESFKK